MKAHFRFLCLCLAMLCVGTASRAQLTGAKTVPSTNYPTLKVAIDSLNQYGVGAGGVIINFTASTNETAPVGGYRLGSATLNASTSATNKVTINGNGNLLTGYVGTSTTADGIFYIMGTDYVTINNLNLVDPATNTTTTTWMEWGYSLVKLSGTAPFDGCQYVTINGCIITLNKTYINTIGIRAVHSIAATTTVLTNTGATAASTNSYNNFTGNTITGVTRGISLVGISVVAAYDKRNVIGGTSASQGNNITAGGATNTCYNVWTQYDSVITISYNNFYVNPTQGNTSVYEVYTSTGVGDLTVTNNLFDINCNMTSASMYAYWNSSAHTDPTNGINAASTHNISNNTITGNNPVATSSYLYGLYESSVYSKNCIISNNNIRDINWNVSTGYLYLVYQYLTLSPNVVVDNNTIYNIQQRQTGSSGYIYGLYLYNYSTPTGKLSMQNNVVRKIKSNYFLYAYYNYASYTAPPTGYSGQIVTSKNNITDSVDLTTAATGYCYNYLCYNGFDSSESSYNKITNIQGSLTGTTYIYAYNYGGYAPKLYTIKGNLVNNVTGFNMYMYGYIGYYGTLVDSNTITNVTTTGTAGSVTAFLGYYGANYTSSNNRVNNINLSNGQFQAYMGMYGSDATVRNNAITNINLTGASGYVYNYIGYNIGGNSSIYNNRLDSFTQGTSANFYPWYSYIIAGTTVNMYNNIISNLTTAAPTIAFYPYYLYSTGATAQINFYNNFLTNINLPTTYTGTNSAGIYMPQPGIYNLYNNTIRTGASFTGATGSGFTGIWYAPTAMLDLRNNIINVNITPNGGFTTALRRTSGTAGTAPSNFLGTSNGNIFYTPTAANSWIYGEGSSAAGMVNAYNLTNDPNFNTPCGLFKSFMGHDQASFSENNLVAGALPATYVPTGVSYAEKGSVPTGAPAVVTDFAGVTRGAVADIGALEFSGTSLDNAPPIISYTPLPIRSYCAACPTLLATITDNSGVNNTTGTAPRLYYKKSSETNAFSATNNTSTFNGWKWVGAASVSGSNYTFNFDCSLLTSGLAPGDSISYFIIAQDNASTVNAGASVVGFPVCPSSVALGSPHGPTNPAPAANGFKILSTPIFKADAFPGSACGSGSAVISVTPVPVGATVQWQTATLTGAFTNITGATGTSYTTPVNTTTLRYRAIISCGTSTLATTAIDTFIIANPSIISTTGATRCGYGSLTLTATGAPFTFGKWYTTATGGTSFFSGNSYTTPNINSSVTYYVGGNTPNASTEIVSLLPQQFYTYGGLSGSGIWIRFRNAATNFYSTTVYPYSATGTFEVELLDSVGNSTGYKAGPFSVSGGAGTTPVVLPLNWNNIKPGNYQLLMVNHTGTPYLNMEYMPRTTPTAANFPFYSPSGNASIDAGIYSGVAYYYCFFYHNVIGADCESSAPRKPVTATITPAPPITVSSPGFPGICLGTSTTINVTSPNTSYIFNWMPGSLSGASHTVSPTTATTYAVTATDPYTGCVNFDTVRLFVNPVPAPPTIAPISPKICEGSSVILVGSAPPGSSGTKQVGSGSTAITSMPNPFYGTYTGNRSQYLIKSAELVAAGIKPGLLTSLAFQSSGTGFTLLNFEIRLANVSMASLPSTITCAPGMTSVYTQASLVPPTSGWNTFVFNGSTFNWTGGDLLVDVSNMNCTTCPVTACNSWGASASVLGTSQSYQSAVGVWADLNCGVTACPTTGSYNTSVSTVRPNMQIGYREPSDLNWLNVTGLYKNAGLTNTVSLTDTNTVVYASPTTTTVYRAITNAQGCLSGPSLPDTVFVDPAPLVTIAPAGPQTICSGQPVTLCIPTGLNQSYQWYLNNVAIAGANTNCYVAGAAGSYKVTATNIITGCSATSIPTVLTVNAVPTITATAGGSTTICNGSCVTLTANSPTAIAWQWQVGGVNIPGATSSTYSACSTGNYTVVVTNSFSCSNTSNTVAVTVNTTPSTVTPQGSTSFCTGGSVVLQAPTGATYTYQWYDGAGPLTGATSSSYTATATGNYYVIITNTTTGCSSTSVPIAVTVGAGPNATINPQGNVGGCQGGTVTLRAISQPGLCYQWNLNGSPIGGANADTFVASAGGNYTVTVTICATPACYTTTAVPTNITLNPPPAAAVTPTNPTPFCQGGSTTLSANTGAGLSYQWQLNGTPISGATSATYSAVSNGSYEVVVTNTTTGCTKVSNTVPVTVYAAPNAAVTPATNPTFCQGGSVVLNAATTSGATYRWNLNGTPIPGAPGAGTSYTATATGLYTVTVTNPTTTCSATSPATSVQVNALPNVTTIPTGNAAVCQGYNTVLTAPSGPSLSYQWYNGATAITGATSNTYTTGTAGTYTVRITNSVTGCVATSANIVLVVNTPPPAVASATGTTTICQDDSVKLSANTGTGFIYQWKLNGNDIVGLDPTNPVYYAKVAGRYTVSVSNATNCTTLSNSIVITVNPRPAAYITYNTPLEFCEGSAVVLVANPGTGLTYQWYMDGTPLANTSNNNISSVSGLYSLKVTNTFGCSTNSDALNVTVYPTPVPTIIRTNSTLQTSQPYSSYQWFFNNNAIGGATSDSYVFTANGAYKVRVVDANGCEGTSDQFFVNNVGIAQTAAGKSIKVYPNPTSGIVNIEASVKVKVVLRDVAGKSVMEAKDVKQIDLADIAKGMYLLYISDMNNQLLRVEKVRKTDQ